MTNMPRGSESLRDSALRPKKLATVAETADFLSVSPAFVYENADRLGAIRLSSSPKARLRFDLDEVVRRLTVSVPGSESTAPVSGSTKPTTRRRRQQRSGTVVELLPIRGQTEAAAR